MRTSAADTRRARGTWLRLALLALLVVLALVPATTDVTHALLTDTTTTTGVVSTLPEFPAYERSTGDVVDLMTTRLYAAVDTMRAARDQADAEDPITADILHQLIEGLEKQAWLLKAENWKV